MSGASANGQVGPGGGGGGGAFWFSGASIPATVSAQNTPGLNGVISFNGSPWGATAGTAGSSLTGLVLPVANTPFVTPCVNDTVVNAYAAVLGYDTCTNTLTVDSTNNFFAGDTVILIQMKGVAFDTTNTPAFGNVLAYNNAGNYEYNVVLSKTANTITLRNVLLRTYTINGGAVQLVRVPSFTSYATSAPHTARPWNGVKGGVLALNVSGTLTLGHQMRANGKGFAGGQKNMLTAFGCNRTAYFYPPTTNEGAKKGEGPATISQLKSCGRGALVSGGGGGNDHNSGGGGGGNGGSGGRGGFQHPLGGCSPILTDIGGVGGRPLVYSNTDNRAFLGGGGGCGHGNDFGETPGGAGGGLVFVRAANVVVTGGSISAHGGSSPSCPGPGLGCDVDGGGGGGAAGAVLLHAGAITGNLNIAANGGSGANVFHLSGNPQKMGPGGGGGGGTVWVNGTGLPTGVSTSVAGGIRGVHPQLGNDTFGAIHGSPGVVLAGLQMPVSTVQFVPAPPVTIQDSVLNCRTVLFTATGGGAGIPTWNFGNGGSATGNPVTYTYPAGGTFVASVQVPGCGGSDTETVVLPSDPVVTVTGNASVCAGSSTPLTAAGAPSFTWSPSTGLSATTGTSVTATPTVTTTYTVTGIAATGCTDTAMHTLTVNPVPTVTASSSPSTICEGASSTLTASTAIPATFSWTPGGATQGITQVAPITTTIYTVTATAAGCTASDTATVTVLPKPAVTVTTPAATVCPQSSIVLTASAGATSGSFTWAAPASGTSSSITTGPITSPTSFSVYFTASNGCRDTATQAIGVHPLPTVAINGPALLCSGSGPATFTATGASSYVWSPAQYLNATTGNIVQSMPPVGTLITYAVTGTDANGCIDTAQHTLTVEPSPTVSAGPDTAVCSGTPIVLRATGTASIVWSPTNSSAGADSILVLETVNANTTYTYIATGTAGACSDSDTVRLTVRALPTVLTTPKTAVVCLYDSARLRATGAATYVWTPAAGLSNPGAAVTMAKPDAATTYTVTGTDAFGCVNRDTSRVNVGDALPVKASGDGQPISCDNSLAQLHATGATSYVWSPGQYLNDSTMAHPVATPPTSMQFTVIGSNSAGCTGRDTITVISLKESTLTIPNIFTPNGDGLNDRVYPTVQCDFRFQQWSIYDRWGKRVYFSTDETKGWDGQFNGRLCDVGVYVYVLNGVGDAGNAKMLTGNVTLTR